MVRVVRVVWMRWLRGGCEVVGRWFGWFCGLGGSYHPLHTTRTTRTTRTSDGRAGPYGGLMELAVLVAHADGKTGMSGPGRQAVSLHMHTIVIIMYELPWPMALAVAIVRA